MKKIFNLEEKINLLKDYFSRKQSVITAYVFGSFAKGRVMSESDFDIAVYFRPNKNEIEYEEEREYYGEDKIWGDVEKIVGVNTDFIVLNRCPSTLAFEILQTGKQIIIKDRGIWLDFYLAVSSVAEDFREFIKDYWEIEQRSASLSETDRIKLIKKIKFLSNELSIHHIFKDLNFKIYADDAIKRLSVERWIENIVNVSIDIAKILLASKKKKMPDTYKETLKLLAILPDFKMDVADELSKFVKLRNILAHEYLDIRFERIKKFIQEAKPIYEKLIDYVKMYVKPTENGF